LSKILDHGRDMTTGPLTRHLLVVAWPVSVSWLMQTLYNLVDAFWLGKLGKEALVAPTITMHLEFFGIAVAMGLGQACTSLISQYKGAGRPERMGLAAGQSVLVHLIAGTIIAGVCLMLAQPLLRLLHTPADAFAGSLTYLRWIMAGLPLLFIVQVYQGIYNGLGDTRGPMRIIIISVLVNLLLDPLLIFGWGPLPAMGVGGAAAATVISRGLAAVLATRAIFGGPGLRVHRTELKWNRRMMNRLIKVALPLSAGQAATSLGFTLLLGMVNSFGSAVVAAFGVGHRVIMMVSVPSMALGQANATAVGQNLGAGQPERAAQAVRRSAILVTAFLLPLTTLTFFFGGDITHWFIADPEVIAHGRDLFRITSFSVFVFSLIWVMFSAFSGSGHTVPIMVVNVGRLWVVRIPATWLLTQVLSIGTVGLWWAMNLSNVAAAVVAFIWFLKGTWKRAVIDDEDLDEALPSPIPEP
jgi:putative MATE family efflux protein